MFGLGVVLRFWSGVGARRWGSRCGRGTGGLSRLSEDNATVRVREVGVGVLVGGVGLGVALAFVWRGEG